MEVAGARCAGAWGGAGDGAMDGKWMLTDYAFALGAVVMLSQLVIGDAEIGVVVAMQVVSIMVQLRVRRGA